MYLISIYFDNETEERLNLLIQRVAKVTGNQFMLDNQVPPHITVASVETKHEDELSARIEKVTKALVQGEIKFVSTGSQIVNHTVLIPPYAGIKREILQLCSY